MRTNSCSIFVHGAGKKPGELRRSQNWIGVARPGNAVFVPPPLEQVQPLLAEMKRFIHAEKTNLPTSVLVGLVHARFEKMQLFLDGNGGKGSRARHCGYRQLGCCLSVSPAGDT